MATEQVAVKFNQYNKYDNYSLRSLASKGFPGGYSKSVFVCVSAFTQKL